MSTLFLSDIHLEESRTDITAQFVSYLEQITDHTDRLFIVGDLFEAWIGDDAPGAIGQEIIDTLAALTQRGVKGFFTHGNRDFLVGDKFSQLTGFSLLEEECIIDCYGQSVLLLHGDTLCTDDVEYQALRTMVRNPDWQKQILELDVDQRITLAQQMRKTSQEEMQNKTEQIMDVNQVAVEETLRKYDVTTMLHGHTHRPNVHEFESNKQICTRIVLGDWYTQGSVLEWSEQGYELRTLSR